MGLNDVRLMAEREKELVKLKDNYEETMAKMKEKRNTMEVNIQRLREEAANTQIEINRLKSLIANNKRAMEETDAARARLIQQIRDLCLSYQGLVSPQFAKRLAKQV